MVPSLPTQVVGNTGLFFVCYQLSMRGWNVLPTSRNAKGVDVLIYDEQCDRKYTVQVKALSKRDPVPVGKSPEFIADFLIVCNKVATSTPEVFIMSGDEVPSLLHRGERNGKVSYWLQPKSYEAHKDAWHLIGTCYGL